MHLGVIIQARMGSSRLPAKVLKRLPEQGGRTVLEHVVRRCRQVMNAEVLIATTTSDADLPLVKEAERLGVKFFRGSEDDVLERYYLASKRESYDTVMRITSDCPCHDPNVLNDLIGMFRKSGADYASNCQKRTFPHGLDAEIFSFAALEEAYRNAQDRQYREHVTPYLYKSGRFKTADLVQNKNTSEIRVTLDTEEDYALLRAVFEFLGDDFTLQELENLFAEKSWLSFITKSVVQKAIYDSCDEELKAAINLLEKQDMKRAADMLRKGIK